MVYQKLGMLLALGTKGTMVKEHLEQLIVHTFELVIQERSAPHV